MVGTRIAYRICLSIHRVEPHFSRQAPRNALPELDLYLLAELMSEITSQEQRTALGNYIIKLARLGGYLARAHDPPPGNTVIWIGLSRLTDIGLGIIIGVQFVDN